jgi:hypothetical protein
LLLVNCHFRHLGGIRIAVDPNVDFLLVVHVAWACREALRDTLDRPSNVFASPAYVDRGAMQINPADHGNAATTTHSDHPKQFDWLFKQY